MTSRPSISVVIPTFNRRERVQRAVGSVLAQTLMPEEFLVVDDGSTDHTASALRKRYPGVDVLRQDRRQGPAAARNRGIEATRGELVAFLDSDDEWLPEKLEAQVAEMEEHPDLPLCHTNEIWIRDGRRVNPRKIHRKQGGWLFERSLELCCISPSSVILRRDVFREVGDFDESLPACEDYDLWLRITSRYPVVFVDKPLVVKHGGHSDQVSSIVPALDRFRIKAIVKILESGGLDPEQRDAAVSSLLRRIEIYAGGCRKRGRHEEAESLVALRDRWLTHPS